MYIPDDNPQDEKRGQLEDFYFKNEDRTEEARVPERNPLEKHLRSAISAWQAPEFETYERDKRWYAYLALIFIAIIGYAVYSNSPVMAITFILIGVILYLQLHKEPKVIDFAITAEGMIAGKEMFEFDQVHSFWIFYDPPQEKFISLHTKGRLVPFMHIPIDDQNPVELREILLQYIPEVKQNLKLVDILERLLRI